MGILQYPEAQIVRCRAVSNQQHLVMQIVAAGAFVEAAGVLFEGFVGGVDGNDTGWEFTADISCALWYDGTRLYPSMGETMAGVVSVALQGPCLAL